VFIFNNDITEWLEGTSGTIWSSLSWQKHGLDKMSQHPVQFSLHAVRPWLLTLARGFKRSRLSSMLFESTSKEFKD